MSEIVLRSTARVQVRLTSLLETVRDRLAEQDGQDTIEYLGVLLVVAAVIAVVLAVVPGLQSTISSGAKSLINGVFSAGS